MNIIVTHMGPCRVSDGVFKKILEIKDSGEGYAKQILFTVECDEEAIDVTVESGEVTEVKTMDAFEEDFILEESPVKGRRILL